ncbi:MAG: putative sulfate exporter family transporter [Planctomycetota bacterium]|nr:putative sulfate exporter family transporter [Planctomycetota bacterium]
MEAEPGVVDEAPRGWQSLLRTEDWWAIWIGGFLIVASFLAVWNSLPADFSEQIAAEEKENPVKARSPATSWLTKADKWSNNPLDSFFSTKKEGTSSSRVPGILAVFFVSAGLFGIGIVGMRQSLPGFLLAFPLVFLLAVLAFVLAEQEVVAYYNMEYVLWALLVGLIISNTVGTPTWLRPAVRGEFYIKTGLVLLGAEVLLSELLALGLPGVFVSWVTTPVVLISTYIFGQKVLKMESKTLNIVISADMSVCGASAAIATAAACKAKKEELSLAIGISLAFTAIMMIVLPAFIKFVGMDEILGGAWIGGTIDSTGAVSAAGGALGKSAEKVAITIKLIQNVLIGVVAFGVAVYWATYVERDKSESATRPRWSEIWHRFPKFILGFVAASLIASWVAADSVTGSRITDAAIEPTKQLRVWFFCLAFVSIGLETNFRELWKYLRGGKALTLYVVGQSLNLTMTLFMAWLMFKVFFPDAAKALGQ